MKFKGLCGNTTRIDLHSYRLLRSDPKRGWWLYECDDCKMWYKSPEELMEL